MVQAGLNLGLLDPAAHVLPHVSGDASAQQKAGPRARRSHLAAPAVPQTSFGQ